MSERVLLGAGQGVAGGAAERLPNLLAAGAVCRLERTGATAAA